MILTTTDLKPIIELLPPSLSHSLAHGLVRLGGKNTGFGNRVEIKWWVKSSFFFTGKVEKFESLNEKDFGRENVT